jgi:hypothetical protein
MIYLIITTSINNRYGVQDANDRRDRYLYAISETLKVLPDYIKPIIVENNGERSTYLDNFLTNNNEKVPVIYTDNNKLQFKSKGVNEILDIKEVIERCNISDDDIIIKLTGRYRVISSHFFEEVINNKNTFDAFVKFFGTCSLQFEKYDCILGCYAIQSKYIKLYNHTFMDNYKSAEIAFARYVRFCGANVKEIIKMDLECCFAEDKRILIV